MSSFNCSPVSVENEQAIKLLEVAFKAGRIGIFINSDNLPVQAEEFVVVEADKGIDIGKVIMKGATYGEHTLDDQAKKIVRVATEEDLLKFNKNRELEDDAVRDCKEKIIEHRLSMNLVDAEYQLDHSKLTFYFTAEQRVDFRKLVRDLASQYRTRIELRQIGVRDAARHVGGYGSCGCQLCCTLFLRKFENITTQYIKDQLIPMSPSRLTGICGRLKCCLAYERDFYLEELGKYPTVGEKISTPSGAGIVEKVDIFNSVIYFRNAENDIVRMDVGDLVESH